MMEENNFNYIYSMPKDEMYITNIHSEIDNGIVSSNGLMEMEFLPPQIVKEMLDNALNKLHLHKNHKDYKQFVKGFKIACKMIKSRVEFNPPTIQDNRFYKPIETNIIPI